MPRPLTLSGLMVVTVYAEVGVSGHVQGDSHTGQYHNEEAILPDDNASLRRN